MAIIRRISPSIENILNTNLKLEYKSFYLYTAISKWCKAIGLYTAASTFKRYAEEELKHATKLENYLIDRNCIALSTTIDEVKLTSFTSLLQVLELSLEHEMTVSAAYTLARINARNDKDESTYEFLSWYVNEQVEEERKFSDVIIQVTNILGLTYESKGVELLMADKIIE